MRNITSPSVREMTHMHSLWRSPLPYLMGGLGAMLVLIIFALLLLLFSHCNKKRSTLQEGQSRDEHGENEKIEMGNISVEGHGDCEMEKRVVVIMAGHENPTFIAKPTSIAEPEV